jgi:hypothetical protein
MVPPHVLKTFHFKLGGSRSGGINDDPQVVKAKTARGYTHTWENGGWGFFRAQPVFCPLDRHPIR